MRVGIVGTGAIAAKHAQAYQAIGFTITACTNRTASRGEGFAAAHGTKFIADLEELCRHPEVDYVDVCTFPNFRLPIVELCARYGKHVLVQKPIAIDPPTARRMIETARAAGIHLGVACQHRFDDATLFLARALAAGRLGRLLQADAYVKWYRSPEYYNRAGKGEWLVEGGGALINQAIHQLDLLLHLAGPIQRVFAEWQLGGLHSMQSEDSISAVLRYRSGALGCIQAATSFWPGYQERIELHGTCGSAAIHGDQLAVWDLVNDHGEPPPIRVHAATGSSDPMAIGTRSFERLFLDFAEACRTGRAPGSSAEDALAALEVVTACYRSCRTGSPADVGLA